MLEYKDLALFVCSASQHVCSFHREQYVSPSTCFGGWPCNSNFAQPVFETQFLDSDLVFWFL